LVLSTMIVSGAVIGWLVLGERVGIQTQAGMLLLIVALVFFSLGARQAQLQINPIGVPTQASTTILWLAIAGNMLGGLSYAFLGLSMRRAFQSGMPIETAILILSTVAVILLFGICYFRISWEQVEQVTSQQWMLMIVAGVLNGLSFILLGIALRNLHLVFAQMVNATQATLASIAGYLVFAEPLTSNLIIGLLFTITGLTFAGLQKKPTATSDKTASSSTSTAGSGS
jgi:drug/metabolite transporter, DME family